MENLLSFIPVSSTQQTVEGFHFSARNSSTVAFPKYFIGDFKWLACRAYCGPGDREWDESGEIDMCNALLYEINLVQYCYTSPWWTGETCCAHLVTWTWALHNGEKDRIDETELSQPPQAHRGLWASPWLQFSKSRFKVEENWFCCLILKYFILDLELTMKFKY